MTAAIVGLLGVIVGGVLNGVVTYWLEYRREDVALKAAARLLGHELTVALASQLCARRREHPAGLPR